MKSIHKIICYTDILLGSLWVMFYININMGPVPWMAWNAWNAWNAMNENNQLGSKDNLMMKNNKPHIKE